MSKPFQKWPPFKQPIFVSKFFTLHRPYMVSMKLNDFVQLNQKTVAIAMRGKCSRIMRSRLPQHNVNDVSTEKGTLSTNVQAQPHFTKYKLNKLSDLAKYVRGYGAKSPINDTKNKLPRYRATFKFVSKKIIFLHMCSTVMSNTS